MVTVVLANATLSLSVLAAIIGLHAWAIVLGLDSKSTTNHQAARTS